MAALAAVACSLAALSSGPVVRGVHPSKLPLYDSSKQTFTCLDGSETIPFAHVNDDYCDCADGSDEPGTSACTQSVFYCENKGHAPSEIPSSRVNDGVCDCCDAADEWATGACKDTCAEAGRAAREAAALERERRVEGSKKRELMIAKGKELTETQRAELDAFRPEMEQAETECEAAKKAMEEAEEPEKVAKEAADAEWDISREAGIEAAKRSLFDHIDEDKSGLITLDEVPLKLEFDTDADGQVSTEETEDVFDLDGDGAVNETEKTVDFETFKERMYADVQPKFEASHPQFSEAKPAYADNVQELIDTAQKARDAHVEADRKASDLRSKVEGIESKLNMDYGESREWAESHGQCYESTNGEYTYVICPFDKAEQKESGRSHSLGTWKGFDGPEGSKYTVMKFEGGASCWQGPQRSMRVTLECGVEPEVYNVQEPSKCTYTASMRHPALCTPPPASHDEL